MYRIAEGLGAYDYVTDLEGRIELFELEEALEVSGFADVEDACQHGIFIEEAE